MEEMEVREQAFPATLDSYVQQGQMFLYNAQQNLIQYGRVLTEAKALVPHGRFGQWVQQSFGMSERAAQGYMQVWKRFGQSDRLAGVQFSNLQKMLALPEGTEDQFAREHDVENMTARQVAEAVAKVREQSQSEIERERKARKDAERRAKAAEEQAAPNEALSAALRDKSAEAERYREQAERARDEANVALQGQKNALKQMQDAKNELSAVENMLAENQAAYNELQNELLNAKSAAARGDAERTISEQLSGEAFAAAVRLFLGSTAQMPFMGSTFSQITESKELQEWDSLLSAVEDWAVRARKALNTVNQREVIIDG